MKDKDIYKKRVDPSKVKFTEYRRGVYGSYGNRDLKTYQCKLPREPFEEFDKKRKEYHMNKNEILLGFIEYYNRVISIERKDLANKQHFTKNETIKKQFMEYKQKMYKKYIENDIILIVMLQQIIHQLI